MAVILIILLNLTVTLLFFRREDKHNFLFMPYRISQGEGYRGWIYSHLSHAGWTHLLFNMMTLFFFAPVIEEQMGAPYLLILYIITGLGADLAVYTMHYKNPSYACLGASGSVSGILFGAIVLRPEMKLFLMFLPIPIPAPLFAVGYIALSFYLARRGGDGISHEAHIGGALAGLALTALLSPAGLDPLIEQLWPG